MRAGQLRTRITIERPSPEQDGAGQPIESWKPVVTVWADLRTVSGLETIRAGAETAIVKASARIRWRPGLDSSMRVLAGGSVFQITAVLPDLSRRQYIDLVLEKTS